MRISDWSSDVCSSDLADHGDLRHGGQAGRVHEVHYMARSAASFGIGADDKARSVHEPDQRDVEAVAHHGEVHDLATGLRRQGAATGLRVVGDDAPDLSVVPGVAVEFGTAQL